MWTGIDLVRNLVVSEAELHQNASSTVHQAPQTQRESQVGQRALERRLRDLLSSPAFFTWPGAWGKSFAISESLSLRRTEQLCDGARSFLRLADGAQETMGLLPPWGILLSCWTQAFQRLCTMFDFSRESALLPSIYEGHYGNFGKYRLTQREEKEIYYNPTPWKESYSRGLQVQTPSSEMQREEGGRPPRPPLVSLFLSLPCGAAERYRLPLRSGFK